MSYKIGIIIPSTTKGINGCRDYKGTYLYKIFLKSFYNTYTLKCNNKTLYYTIYVVVDDDDKIYSNEEDIIKIKSFISLLKNVEIKFISSAGIPKGWVTKMWNRAFKQAYDDGCDYFYQCGDDIEFLDKDWVDISILTLEKNNNIGVTGPHDYGRELKKQQRCSGWQNFIMTQTFVSRKHMEYFNFYFPPEIKNWFCDDWITYLYGSLKKCYPLKCRIINRGGMPRYTPEGLGQDGIRMRKFTNELIEKYKVKVK